MSFADLTRWSFDVLKVDDTKTGHRMGKYDSADTVATGLRAVIHDARLEDVMAFERVNERITSRVQFEGPVMVAGAPYRLDTTHQIIATHDDTGLVRKLKVKAEKIPVADSMPHVAHCEEQPR